MTTVILLWALALWRLPAASRSQKQASLSNSILFLAVAMTFDQPGVITRVDPAVGINDFSNLLKHAAGLLAAGSLLEFVIEVVDPRRMPPLRTRLALAYSVITALSVSFFLSPRPVEQKHPFEDYTGELWPSVYMLIFALSIGVAMVVATKLFLGARRQISDRWTRIGLLCLGLGTGIGILYALVRVWSVSLPLFNAICPLSSSQESRISDVFSGVAILLIVVGRALPLVPQLSRVQKEFRLWVRLRPLWRPLTRSVPHVMITRNLALKSMELWLHLRVLEISDAQLALREYVSLEEAGDPPLDVEHRAAYEADWLVLAMSRQAEGLPRVEAPYPPRGCEGLGLEEELVWLTHLTRAFRERSDAQSASSPATRQEVA